MTHTHRTIALALAEVLPRRTNIFHVELIDATGDCTVRARIGESFERREEIAGIGSTIDAAVADILERADRITADHQAREIFDMTDEQVLADLAADGVTDDDLERGVEHIQAMAAEHKARSAFARSVPPLSEIEIERLRQHASALATGADDRDPIDPLMVLGLVATLDRARRPDAHATAVIDEIEQARQKVETKRLICTVRGCVNAALAFAGVVGQSMTGNEFSMMSPGETRTLPGGMRIVRTTEDMFELWRDA